MSRSHPSGCFAPALLILSMTAAAMAVSLSPALGAYLLAVWHGDVDGPALWLPVIGVGLVLGALLVLALCWLADTLHLVERCFPRDRADDVPPHDPHARFESLILALVLMGLPVIALTR